MSRICEASSGRNGSGRRSHRHAHHVSEIRTDCCHDVFLSVREGATSLVNPAKQYSEIGPEQHNLSCLCATSTAFSTEMLTSAACSAGASLIPSPRYPTT
ncbi:MAG UNVERIFIED_CONTAM: hypothetical protein LVR18_39585 [Planctomycetaceae bacterium]